MAAADAGTVKVAAHGRGDIEGSRVVAGKDAEGIAPFHLGLSVIEGRIGAHLAVLGDDAAVGHRVVDDELASRGASQARGAIAAGKQAVERPVGKHKVEGGSGFHANGTGGG